jgi:hypothetical protein
MRGLAIAAETRSGFLQFVPDEPRIGRSLEHYGEWLQPRLDVALRFVRPELSWSRRGGAGAHALRLARAAGGDGTLLAYESRPAFRRLLAQNLAAHRIANVSVMARAIGADRFASAVSRSTISAREARRNQGQRHGSGRDPRRRREHALAVPPMAARRYGRSEGTRTRARRVARVRLSRVAHGDTAACAGELQPPRRGRIRGREAHALLALPEEVDARPLPGCDEWL